MIILLSLTNITKINCSQIGNFVFFLPSYSSILINLYRSLYVTGYQILYQTHIRAAIKNTVSWALGPNSDTLALGWTRKLNFITISGDSG